MNILFVAATDFEISKIKEHIDSVNLTSLNHTYSFLVTGIGIARSTFAATQYLGNNSVDMVIQIGVAGSYHTGIPIGEVVWVVRDYFADMGAETDRGFIRLSEIGLSDNDFMIESSMPKLNIFSDLKKVSGITSDIIHHREKRITEIRNHFNPDVETMEGASIMYVCEQLNVPSVQIRSISNEVTTREKNNWDIEKSMLSLNEYLKKLILELENQPK